MTKKLFLIFMSALLITGINAQEVLYGLPCNPVLTSIAPVNKLKTLSTTLLELPFFDDFSNNSVYPDERVWNITQSADVFVNNSYGRGLVSIGVATFDAVNSSGSFSGNASSSPYISDKLTSYAIDLSDADMESLYLSFYYQPQGYGNAPEPGDSLILQVRNDTVDWENIWSANGQTFRDFRINVIGLDDLFEGDTVEFKYVMVKIDSLKYKAPGFKFRFMNYASLSADHSPSSAVNCDHWNIDYVYLNDGRDTNEVALLDVACIEPPRLFLRNYESVPWSHYREVQRSQLAKKELIIRNNDIDTIRTIEPVELLIEDISTNNFIDSTYIAAVDLDQGETKRVPWKYEKDPLFNVGEVDEFKFRYHLRFTYPGGDSIPQNNTASKEYNFSNYYAYDDGVAENAYGVEANGARVAYMFNSFIPDTLRGVYMYFLGTNPSGRGARSFKLCVWENNGGLPGELLTSQPVNTEFGVSLNEFFQYSLNTPVPVDGEFFIGWEQVDELRLNVGFDVNRVSSENLFFNIYGDWEKTEFNGSLMMRPLLGYLTETAIVSNRAVKGNIKVYPNPASNTLKFSGIDTENIQTIRIYNSVGKLMVQHSSISKSIDVSFLDNGVYILSVTDKGGNPYNSRFIIAK